MDDVLAWLDALGLARYAQTFSDNDVDFEVLNELSDEDLRELGLSLGHRRKLQKALADGQRAASQVTAEHVGRLDRPEAERRQLTVMFADLVGSTELAEELDPEHLRDVNRAYQDTAKNAIEHYGGYVARYMGDGVLAYFGYPEAHEDDAERAVRAGLLLLDQVARLDTVRALRVKVGVATGPVVVGDLIGDGASQESAVVGQSANLAARAQGEAQPNEVVVAHSTRALIRGLFDLEELGARRLRGFKAPQQLWRVRREREVESRFEAVRRAQQVGFVGRRGELALIEERWEAALGREGQVVLLSGDPGIGKSRLAEELIATKDGPGSQRVLRLQCSPYYTNTPLYPVIVHLRRAAGFERGDDSATRLNKLEALTASKEDRPQTLALLASLLSLPTNRYPALELTPQQHKTRTLAALIGEVQELASEAPLLALFEDIHWIDPTTLEMLSGLVATIQEAPVLMLLTHRPEFESPWSSHRHVTELRLNHLRRHDCLGIIQEVAANASLSESLLEEIASRSDGVPLFAEEMTRALIGQSPSSPRDSSQIPASLQASLLARLDRLGAAKETAQLAACIGREFDHELLQLVSDASPGELDARIRALVEQQLLFRRGTGSNAAYTFKHALVQDAAYDSLLLANRRAHHERIATALEELAESAPEVVATHYSRAELPERSVPYWGRAAKAAAFSFSNDEAARHCRSGLLDAEKLHDERAKREAELELLITLGRILMTKEGYGSTGVTEVYERANELSTQVGTAAQRFSVLRGLAMHGLFRGTYRQAVAFAETALETVSPGTDDLARMRAEVTLGMLLYFTGELDRAHGLLGASAARARTVADSRNSSFVLDLETAAVSGGAMVAANLGHVDQAVRMGTEAVARARKLAHKVSCAQALCHLAMVHAHLNDPTAALGPAREALQIAQEHDLPSWTAESKVFSGWANAVANGDPDGVEEVAEALELWRQLGQKGAMSEWMHRHAWALAALGHVDEAFAEMEAAINQARELGELTYLAGLMSTRCRLRANADGLSQALEPSLIESIELARRIGSRVLELRDTTLFAKVKLSHGECDEARGALERIYGRFSEGFDQPDLMAARDLLDDLSSGDA